MTKHCKCCGQAIPEWGEMTLNDDTGMLEYGDKAQYLNISERQIFRMLLDAKGGCRKKNQMYDRIYSLVPECDWPDVKIIEVHICKLRKKLIPMGIVIKTHWGVGYSLNKPGDYIDGGR